MSLDATSQHENSGLANLPGVLGLTPHDAARRTVSCTGDSSRCGVGTLAARWNFRRFPAMPVSPRSYPLVEGSGRLGRRTQTVVLKGGSGAFLRSLFRRDVGSIRSHRTVCPAGTRTRDNRSQTVTHDLYAVCL